MDEMTKASAVPHRPERRGSDAVRFSGEPDTLFERHLRFDSVVDPAAAGARDKFEAAAHAVRDILTQRWMQTQQAYDRENPKRVYYLSMEFLIGRSLTNNITNLMLHSVIGDAVRAAGIDWLGLVEQEPDAGLGNGGLGRCGLFPRFNRSGPAHRTKSPSTVCPRNLSLEGSPTCMSSQYNRSPSAVPFR